MISVIFHFLELHSSHPILRLIQFCTDPHCFEMSRLYFSLQRVTPALLAGSFPTSRLLWLNVGDAEPKLKRQSMAVVGRSLCYSRWRSLRVQPKKEDEADLVETSLP